MKFHSLPMLLMAGMLLGGTAHAQTSPATQPLPGAPTGTQPLSATSFNYTIAADDILSINVVNFKELTVPQVVVTPDGKITLPLLGPVSVSGQTPHQVELILAGQWNKFVVDPSVTVSLIQKHKQTVFISGFVAHPGPVDYTLNMHLMDALATAGDVLPNGDLGHVVVTHADSTKQTYDLTHPETKGGTDADPSMQIGDVITVPEQRDEFSVIGQVNKPGSYSYKTDMTVLDALTATGGVMETANLNDATLIHNGQESKIDLDSLLHHGDMSQNIHLAAGDRLMIPEGNRTYIYGGVVHPGFYTYKPGDRVLDALNSAGGPLRQTSSNSFADTAKVRLIRIDKSKNNAVVSQINLDKFFKDGDMSGNVALQPGDVIFIPDKRRGFQISDLWGVLQGVNLLNLGASIAQKGLGN